MGANSWKKSIKATRYSRVASFEARSAQTPLISSNANSVAHGFASILAAE